MNLSRKILAALTSLALMVMMVGPVGSVQADEPTMEGLQTEVSSLKATIDQLTALIASLQTGATTPVSGGAITGVPTDFTFETDLELGASGDDVHYLQIVLNSDPVTQLATTGVGSPGEETSYFGPLTKGAVINFQEKYTDDVLASWGLTSGTGYVGSTTRAKLNELLETGAGTGPSAPVALSVLSVTPESDAVDVAVDAEISAVFSNALNADTVTSDSVYLVDESDQTVDGSVTYNSLAKKVSFAPTADLASGAGYTVILTTDITSADGIALVEDASWDFVTEGVALIPSEITDAVACVTAGYEWFDGTCHGEVAEVLPSEITDAVECVTAGYEWYSDACHAVDGATAAIGEPLTVALADDTPVGGHIVIGSANNEVTKLVFTAADDADTSISAMSVKSFGTATLGTLDIALVKIMDGVNQIGLSQMMVQGQANFVFTPAINIPMGTSKTLSIAVDMGGPLTATATSTVKMGIELATKIMGATFTGEFPIIGNPYTEIAGGALGTVNVAAGAVVPSNTAYIGETGVVLGNFTVSSGTNEDITVSQFNINRDPASTVQDSDISNVSLLVDGVANGNATTFSSQRAIINLTTPVLITKGTSVTFQVIGDIAAGSTRAIILQANASAVIGVGMTSGSGVAGPAANLSLGAAANTVTIAAGVVSVSVSTASPQGTAASIVISSMPQVLGVYDLRAGGEDLLLTDVGAQLISTGVGVGTIGNFGIYDVNGALLSNTVNLVNAIGGVGTWDNTPANVGTHFTLNTLIPAGTVKQLIFKGTTNGVGVADSVAVTLNTTTVVGMPVAGQSIVATGMTSSGQLGANNITLASTLALPRVTLNMTGTFGTAGVLTGNTTTNQYNQNLLGPVAQAITGTIKVTANNEDQRLRNLVLTGVTLNTAGGAVNTNLYVTSVALYDGSTQITNFVAPGTGLLPAGGAATANDVVFTTADVLIPTTFIKNTPKVLNVVANIISPLPAEGTTLYWTIGAVANHFRTTGVISGAVATNGGLASDFRTNIGAYNEGGTYTMRSNVLEISKSADSPSGTIARGTFATVAKYDLNSKGAGQNLGLSAITFTSTVGLPSALTSSVAATGALNHATLFRLYDVDNGVAIPATRFLNVANGTITFSGITAAAFPAVVYGQPRHLALQITTTNQALWPAYTSMTWTALTTANVVVGQMGTTIVVGDVDETGGGTVYNDANPADASIYVDSVGAAFDSVTDSAYLDVDADGNASLGDVRLWIGTGSPVAGQAYATPLSVIATGDTDDTEAAYGAGILSFALAVTANSLATSNVAVDTFALGTDGLWTDADGDGNANAGDVRLVLGNALATSLNWQGGVGFGGSVYSIPATANTVTIGL